MIVGHRLTDADRTDLATTDDASRLVELLGDVDVLAPSTTLKVLYAEQVPIDQAVE